MTIAPELDGAIDLIRLGRDRGIWMSLGHTVADCTCALAAIDAGACGATHTFNAMRSYDHREPGVLGAVLTDERVWCEMICDFVRSAFFGSMTEIPIEEISCNEDAHHVTDVVV